MEPLGGPGTRRPEIPSRNPGLLRGLGELATPKPLRPAPSSPGRANEDGGRRRIAEVDERDEHRASRFGLALSGSTAAVLAVVFIVGMVLIVVGRATLDIIGAVVAFVSGLALVVALAGVVSAFIAERSSRH